MARHIVLGNRSLLINIDQWLQVRDLFFPRVGQHNHLNGHALRIAVRQHNEVSWLNGEEWEREPRYRQDSLVTDSKATNKRRELSLSFRETVCEKEHLFLREVTVQNRGKKPQKLTLCFHHDFRLYGEDGGDTAFYHPEHQAVIHYKRSSYFLIGLLDRQGKPRLDSYDIGEQVEPSQHLSHQSIAHGEVASLLCTDLELKPGASTTLTYYLAAGTGLEEVLRVKEGFLKTSTAKLLEKEQRSQKAWLKGVSPDLTKVDKRLAGLYRRSLLIIRTQMDKDGAILAANDSTNLLHNKDTYSYCWPRDGALVAISLIKAGFPGLAKEFFRFCGRILERDGYFLHKYNPDTTLGSSWHPWVLDGQFSLPIQEDSTALVLVALDIYYHHTKDRAFIEEQYASFIKPMGEFLARYRYENGLPKESYDLWEERRGIFTFTSAAVLSGLIAAARFGHLMEDQVFCETCDQEFDNVRKAMLKHLWHEKEGYFRRGVSLESGKERPDNAMDSSAYGLWAFNAFEADDPKVVSTMERMRQWLWVNTPVGGFARYYHDGYHQVSKELKTVPGNPWFISTLWYAKWLIRVARSNQGLKEAKALIDWAADHALPTGVMPEQLDPHTGEPISVAPLTWSHAEFVETVNDYIEKKESF